ncbi:hypothetical protein [Paracoccus sp. ME4]|uniref:hypothetical protein n=1 Tax=Paracoccus sp. ME4 TaxID=3138066 RepID=UPI00398B5B2B
MTLSAKCLAALRSATINGRCSATAPAATAGALARLGYATLTHAHTGQRGQCWITITKAGREALAKEGQA